MFVISKTVVRNLRSSSLGGIFLKVSILMPDKFEAIILSRLPSVTLSCDTTTII